ncbi:hypothetical protein J5N97_022351 [Dioscorea zingiberensis]|uniref:Uncharacterized protein n=1 Tax=Dioscorea zingiberensis TaxID=325984 RepID=A0A9D5CAS9_9LILI|nr:hypothetical protein J5N97_022351 [Dioscorea zingiberensis]
MKTKLFNCFIAHNNLHELKFLGSLFTWCNNQAGYSRIYARLDRILANHEWLDQAPSYQVTHLARCQSDHSPLLLNIKNQDPPRRKPFRFDNNWIHLEECRESVANIWTCDNTRNPMHDLSHKFHMLKQDLNKKCKGSSQRIEKDITNTEEEIRQIEANEFNTHNSYQGWTKLRTLYNKQKALLRQNTTFLAQRSRMQWLQNGDCNSKFFHNMTKNHRHNNRINHLRDKNGKLLTDPIEIVLKLPTLFLIYHKSQTRERKDRKYNTMERKRREWEKETENFISCQK